MTHDSEPWTPKFVGECLVEAVRWSEYAAGRVLPADMKSGMPALEMFAGEREFEGWPTIGELDPPKRPKSYSPAKVSQMERVIRWPTLYLGKIPGPTRVLNLWVRCKISQGLKFDRAVEIRGWSRATAYRGRDKALATIAMGLTRDGVVRGQH
ncbi:hypothetical protein SAMN05892877_103407 [Rhizobium subbaraonis]|uniref:Uncharacterized protein n=1 Tax=Rhizobium subbaraonis TaxID=908946 RepID=A0A285U5S2_9HYPH|nr:hypothetical protein [Rhizobium subbaraonis]SOC37063.1 hypothetical protein SAMN05892877_103407 [Rhizobium subbaraonis]